MEDDTQRVYTFVLLFSLAHIALLIYICGWPVWYLPYLWSNAQGLPVQNTYETVAWWGVWFFIVFNVPLPFLLLGAMADLKNPSRLDVHEIFNMIALFVNLFCVALFSVAYFFLVNTSYSGRYPFNSAQWCCEYFLDAPDLCPNSVACAGPYSLNPSPEFILLWIFSGVMTFMCLFSIMNNIMLRRNSPPPTDPKSEAKILGVVLSLGCLVIFLYWAGWPLWYTIYDNQHYLYQWQWVFVVFMVGNGLPPLLFFWALIGNSNTLIINTHLWGTLAIGLLTTASLVLFVGVLLGDCNYPWSQGSMCNSPLFCCQYFDTSILCPNVIPCLQGPVSLYPNEVFIQHIVIAVIFMFTAWVQLFLNFRMRRYGVFSTFAKQMG